jgi:hypothetical protein
MIDTLYARLNEVGFHLSPYTIGATILVLLLPFIFIFFLAVSQKEERLPPPAGCRKYGLQGPSNLSDQYSKKYSDEASDKTWKVKALFIYPLKSCKGVELESSEIVSTGFKYDRQFTLAQHVTSLPSLQGKVTSEWSFITQRTFPRMAKIETEIWVPDPEAEGYTLDGVWVKNEGCLVIRFPFTPDVDFSLQGMKAYGSILAAKLAGKAEPMIELRVPFNPTKERMKKMGYKSEKMKIWKDSPQAINMGSEIPEDLLAKLRYTLGVTNPITLFRIDKEKYREVHKCAPKKKDVGFQPVIGMQDSVRPIFIYNPMRRG